MRSRGRSRRAAGALEAGVLDVLWRSDSALTPGDVLDALDAELAYTTVMTVLTRLHEKGAVVRERRGRAFAYAPTATQADHVAGQMHSALGSTDDRSLTLSAFVDGLEIDEVATLRQLLDGPEG